MHPAIAMKNVHVPVESLIWYEIEGDDGEIVLLQAHPFDGVIRGVKKEELNEYRVSDSGGESRLVRADGPERAKDAVRHHLLRAPVGEPVLVRRIL